MIHLWFAHCHCGSHALAGDPGDDTSEPDGGADVRALWAAREGDRLYFRIDIAQAQIEPLITGLVAAHFVIADDAASGTVVGELRAFRRRARTTTVGVVSRMRVLVAPRLVTAVSGTLGACRRSTRLAQGGRDQRPAAPGQLARWMRQQALVTTSEPGSVKSDSSM